MKQFKLYVKKIIPSTFINVLIGKTVLFCMGNNNTSTSRELSVLIAAPGGGNIGDQAMLESFLHNVKGKKLVITTNTNLLTIPKNYSKDTEVMTLPGLVYGEPLSFYRDFNKFAKRMPYFKSLAVIGADVMDGGYNPHASAMRSYLTSFTAEYGIPSRILGFSWNATPHKKALEAVRKAGESGTELMARDPISYQRLCDAGVTHVVQTSDTVFANQTLKEKGIEDILAYCEDNQVAIVNASGLISKNIDQIEEYKVIVNKLITANYSIVLLPHVIRPGANDLDVCTKIAALYPDIHFVNRLLEPDQIKRLVMAASLVVTGRMHLAIMSINACTPAIVLSTQGKVDGLMQFFSVPSLSVEPAKGFGNKVVDLIDIVRKEYPKYRQHLVENIEEVRRLSIKNFQ
jgi:colanic acid/amylovoran biosynthesis protein